jgi:TetR/AcrR family transcriptional repressor of nem operon
MARSSNALSFRGTLGVPKVPPGKLIDWDQDPGLLEPAGFAGLIARSTGYVSIDTIVSSAPGDHVVRPREFDEATALDAAMHCFWAKGFEATSVRDLAAEMGITGTSLYNAFGDKKSLYRRALTHYLDQSVRERIVRLEGSLPPAEAVAAFFAEVIDRSMRDRRRKGCMLVNTALEVAPHDPEMRRFVAAELSLIEAFFRRCIESAQLAGRVATAVDAQGLGRLLLGVLLGIRVLARTRPQRALLEGVARPALEWIGIGPAPSAPARVPKRRARSSAQQAST